MRTKIKQADRILFQRLRKCTNSHQWREQRSRDRERTFHGGEGAPDLELAPLTVHPDLELHRLQLLPLLLLALVAMASTPSQQPRQILQGAPHPHGSSQGRWTSHTTRNPTPPHQHRQEALKNCAEQSFKKNYAEHREACLRKKGQASWPFICSAASSSQASNKALDILF